MLVRASSANVEWNPKDKQWHVHIEVGAEVIKRPLPNSPQEASEDTLRSAAVETAKGEGYEIDPGKVAIVR
jgi:hypothetical protein